MIGVIFEVWPAAGRREEYLALAATLMSQLQQMDGFIAVERFESLHQPDKLLSLSFFRDEAAVAEWRAIAEHRVAQARGRDGIFRDYRLRVVSTIRDYGMHERAQAPPDNRARHG